ncbi:mediator complex subunit [Exophiala oligosperma]
MAINKSRKLVRYCLSRRLSVQEFGSLLQLYRDELNGKLLFNALVDCRISFCAPGDPLLSLYVEHLGITGVVNVATALLIVINKWNKSRDPQNLHAMECYRRILQDIVMVILSPKYKACFDDIQASLQLSSRWLISLAPQVSHELDEYMATAKSHVVEALAFLVSSLASTAAGCEALSVTHTPDRVPREVSSSVIALRSSVRQSLDLAQYSALSSHLLNRINGVLDVLNQDSSLSRDSAAQLTDIRTMQFEAHVPETHMIASRAATIVYLTAMLSSGSTIDDGALVNYLCTRHQAVFSDVLVVSFHILRAQFSNTDTTLCYQQCRLFLQNKLPSLLSMISASSFNSFDTEQTIVETWALVLMELSNPDLVSVGSRFLYICSLHRLISHSSSLQLIGNEDIISGMSKGLYSKDDLVSQVTSNHVRGPKLVEELIRSDGSAGSISHALVEIMHNYCSSKETQYLKDLSNAVIRKPAAVNCIALFVPPSFWLGPICTLLDEWRWNEIHGEAQPVYDDFGAAFLLVQVCKARLGLCETDLGIRKKDGFLSEFFNNADADIDLESLSEERKIHLGNWINALYLAEGLSDELFTNCSPHDFYILIPTLLRQSITAYQQEKMTQESLKAGLDYLLEPFLLPSLSSALNWITKVLQEGTFEVSCILDVFTKVPGSPDSRDIHGTILSMCAGSLQEQIQSKQGHDHIGLKAASDNLNQYSEFSFPGKNRWLSDHNQISNNLQQSIITMITSNGASTTPTDAAYDISLMVHTAVSALGPQGTLRILLRVLLQLSDSHEFLSAVDTISTIVCTGGQQLKEALRVQHQNLGRILKKESILAEAVVRLHRQVEGYANLLTVQDMNLNEFTFAQHLSNIDTANPNLDGVPTSAGPMEDPVDQEQADGIDQVLDEAAALGSLDSNDADMNFDALYGLQNNDMDLNDLDLDMF